MREDRYSEFRLTLTRQPDGTLAGRMTLDGAPWQIKAWRRTNMGVEFLGLPDTDAEFVALMDRISSKVAG